MRRVNITAITTLLLSNLIPILGVLFADWSVFTIMLLYWIESAVIGLLNIPKMMLAKPPAAGSMKINGKPVQNVSNAQIIPFFMIHYGIFMSVHLGFVFSLFNASGFMASYVELSIVSFLFSHAQSYIQNYVGKKEYENVTKTEVMFQPYKRIIIMHLTIIFSGFFVTAFDAPVFAVILLILLKTAIDLYEHLSEHKKFGSYKLDSHPTNSDKR